MKQKSKTYLEVTQLLSEHRFSDAELVLKGTTEMTQEELLESHGNRYFYEGNHQKALDTYNEMFRRFPESRPARYYYLVGTKMEIEERIGNVFAYYQSAITAETTSLVPYRSMRAPVFNINDY